MNTIKQINFENRTVLLREDLNVPFDKNGILSDVRISAALSTIRFLIEKRAKVIVMSHLGRPKGEDPDFSLQIVADRLGQYLQKTVPVFSLSDTPPALEAGGVAMLENVRFYKGESENDPGLAKRYAALCDIFMMDAFAVSHRDHASTTGVIAQSPVVCMGPLFAKELAALNQALECPKRPWVAVVGGGKVSSKLEVLLNLIDKVDTLVVGGAIANTFLKAKGIFVGQSRIEPELVATAERILQTAQDLNKTIWLPEDVIVADNMDAANVEHKLVTQISASDQIFDIGPQSQKSLSKLLLDAKTIVWNGPMGVFEKPQFSAGTEALSQAIADSTAYSIAGGGETLAAIEQFKIQEKVSVLSTGGGAFLQLLEAKPLPALVALERHDSIDSTVDVAP
tara:strand:- start:3774 stop:4961 length:1188 start_codon:yes stop_codon:yes gene_type:complete